MSQSKTPQLQVLHPPHTPKKVGLPLQDCSPPLSVAAVTATLSWPFVNIWICWGSISKWGLKDMCCTMWGRKQWTGMVPYFQLGIAVCPWLRVGILDFYVTICGMSKPELSSRLINKWPRPLCMSERNQGTLLSFWRERARALQRWSFTKVAINYKLSEHQRAPCLINLSLKSPWVRECVRVCI